MKKILILIQNNCLYFSYKTNQPIREDLMNTNIISDSELVFTDDYISSNKKIVIPFFKELCQMNKIETLVFQNTTLALLLTSFFKNTSVKKIKIKKNETVSYTYCEQIITLKNIEELECFSLANFVVDFLDNHNIKVIIRNETLYLSNFMKKNNLQDYSKIYYKKEINFYEKITTEDEEDFISFLKINRYLKIINFYNFEKSDLEFILNNLKIYNFKNILLQLHINLNKEEDIIYLKDLNKKFKKNKLYINLVYSDDYLKDNLMKQVCLNTIKLCSLIIFLFILGSISYIFIQNYHAMQDVTAIQNKVNSVIAENDNTEPSETEDGLIIKNNYIASLKSINQDIIGYLKVKDTNIDYPVVTSSDNKYYLKKNLYHEDDKNGWIFMDFRNSDKRLNDNTIIYGHNMYYSGVMFGTLHKVLNSSWYSNPENLIISFDTMYESMKWQIYSIYTINKTNDYLQVSFENDSQKNEFINMTKSRSIYDFGIEVNTNDYILTLSTCTNSNERLVVHAKKIS